MPPSQNAPDTKNLALAIALSLAILLGFQYFYEAPRERARLAAAAATQAAQAKAGPNAPAPAGTATPTAQAGIPASLGAGQTLPRPQALALNQRIEIDGPGVDGSLSTLGARFDDLKLKRYKETIKRDAKEVTLLHPQGTKEAYYAFFGYKASDGIAGMLPGPDTVWTAAPGAKLTPTTPVTLTYDNGQGLKFARKIELNDNYLFTITDTVSNSSPTAQTLQSYGALRRHAKPTDVPNGVIHEGMIGVLDGKLKLMKYNKLEKGEALKQASTGGWLGITDKFWLAALIPDQKTKVDATYETAQIGGGRVFDANFIAGPQAILSGQTLVTTQHLYSGGKRVDDLKAIGAKLGLQRFEDAVDWGMFWFLTKPFYIMLMFFSNFVGSNIGLGILIMTVVIKLATFPLVYSSYKSFARMRDLAPKMAEIKERFAADVARQQQETMKLYKDEKINPIAGCIPSLLTMPIFFALFKVLSVAIELRHAPFYGWIPDLYAKDPTTVFNLFGLLPFDPTSLPVIGTFLAIGAWPILYGVSFWLQMKMQPTATDPMQAQIFALMPWMFVFVFASFGSGLVIYYTWSNILTILQQYIIARTSGNSTPIDEFFAKLGKKKPA
jgi:YidC/Oxa1 family membrane protein insertase